MTGKAITLTDNNFAETIGSGVALVDFWAPWCGPCVMQGPIVEKVAATFDGRAKVAKLNVDESGQMAEKYGVRSIPTLIVLKDGKVVQQFVGMQSETQLVSAIEKAL